MCSMAKNTKKNNLETTLSFRLSRDEKKAINDNAKKAGLSLSDYQRKACLEPIIVAKDNVVDKDLVHQLLKIGNNLNQLTKHAHVHRSYDSDRLHFILDRIETLVFGMIDGTQD